jgi:signal peptidase I
VIDDGCAALSDLFLRETEIFDDAGRALAGRAIEIPITGGSMVPTLAPGTVIDAILGDGAACRAGDVVVFRQGQRLIAHRVLRKSARHLVTRGDARIAPDAPVAFAQVVARVTSELPPMPRRRALPRITSAAIVAATSLLLHIHPRLAAAWSRALTWIERRTSAPFITPPDREAR